MKNGNEIAKVKEWFLENDFPYFAIYTTKVDRVWWNNSIDDMEGAAEKLDKFLNRQEPGSYSLYLYDKKTLKEPIGTLKFRFFAALENSGFDSQDDFYRNKYPVQTMLLEQMKELKDEVKLLREQAAIMEDSDDDDDVEEKTEPANVIGAIMGHPAVQNLLMNFLTNITANLTANAANQVPQNAGNFMPQAMAGVPPDDFKITTGSDILDDLFNKGVTWDDLKKLSEMPVDQIKWLLSMLKQM